MVTRRSETGPARDAHPNTPPAESIADVALAAEPAAPTSPPPWELLHPLTAGAAIGHGWRVGDLAAAADGSCVLTLHHERRRTQRIHICRNDGTPQGVIHTTQFDLLVMNGGQGDLPTNEGLAQAIAEIAHALAANERHRLHDPQVTALLPQAERVSRFAAAASLR